MAFDFECKRCGGREAAHSFPLDYPGVCKAYVSPDPKAEAAMWKAEKDEESEREPTQRRLALI